MEIIMYVLIIISLYALKSLLKNPTRFIKFPKIKRSSTSKNIKFKYEDIELGKFKLGKLHLKNMLKGNFIYPSDCFLAKDKYRANFLLGLENYLLYKFPNAKNNEINLKIIEIDMDYWMNYTKLELT